MLKNFLSKKSINEEEFVKELSSKAFELSNVEQLFNDNNLDLNWTNENNETMLHICAKKGYASAIKWLIEKGANIEAQTDDGSTPIFYSINSKDREAIYILIEAGANVNHLNKFNRTVLQEAVITASNKFIDILIQHTKKLNNCDVHGNNLIFDAVANGSEDVITKIAQLDSIDINQINEEGHTILHKEVILKDNELAMKLLELGADPTIQDKEGKNFLFYAVSKGSKNINVIKKAVELGCNINTKSSDNTTILNHSVDFLLKTPKNEIEKQESHLEMINALIHLGANLSIVDDNNENIFFKATRALHKDLINLILNSEDININHQNINGETALFILILNGGINHLELIKSYIENGADINIRNSKNQSIIEILIDIILYQVNHIDIEKSIIEKIENDAEYPTVLAFLLKNSIIDLEEFTSSNEPLFFKPLINYNFKLFKLLKSFDIDINQKDANGNNILFKLMEVKNAKTKEELKIFLNTIQSLINLNVNLNAKNKDGESILHKAITDKCEYTLKLLLTNKADILSKDKQGRTIMHTAVLMKKGIKYFKLIYHFNKDVANSVDAHGFTPLNYAAFMGQKKLVITMLDNGVAINNPTPKDPKMLKFFEKFHPNILKLTDGVENELDKNNLQLLINEMAKEFNIKVK